MLRANSERLGLGQRALGLLDQALKRGRILNRQVRQNLAVQFDSRDFQPVDKLVIAQPVQLRSSSNAHNPQRPILPLPLLPPAVSELEAAFYGLFGRAVEF